MGRVGGKSGQGRTRSYATVVYPESALDNWESLLTDLHIPCLISPLHDKDVNPNGEPKKPHYHVLLLFDSVKSEEQAREVIAKFGGVGCEKVNSTRGYARYLCHLDNPEKAQYNTTDVKQFFGADYQNIIPNNSDKYGLIKDMQTYIRCNHIYFFNKFFDYCAENNEDWFRALCDSSAYIIKEYMKSMYVEEKSN